MSDSGRRSGAHPGLRGRRRRAVSDYSGSIRALDRILDLGGDADDVLRGVVRVLAERYAYAAIKFVEGDDLLPGPAAGTPDEAATAWPISFQGMKVAELEVAPARDGDRE